MAWEDTFKTWSSGPSDHEHSKMENAETAIRKAISQDSKLLEMDISIIVQGSYRARTNVRLESDVDICICLNSTFFPRYPEGMTAEDYNNSDGSINFAEFKNLVHTALNNYFGKESVTPGSKAFRIHSNLYRVDADVVPAFAYRYYYGEDKDDYLKPTGIAFNTIEAKRIVNWPHHTYENGKEKHISTAKRYKKIVRILKRLRNKMQEEKVTDANDIGSFFIESMVWNTPDSYFNHDTYTEDVREVLAFCFNQTLEKGNYKDLHEVNGIKFLFGKHQPCTREKAHDFFSAAWDYLDFE